MGSEPKRYRFGDDYHPTVVYFRADHMKANRDLVGFSLTAQETRSKLSFWAFTKVCGS